MNIKNLSLRALRDQINAGTRTVDVKSDDGSISQMVYIPKFTVPKGIWESGDFPAEDMNLGGFFIDKYQASHKAATPFAMGVATGKTIVADSTDDVPVSLPGRVPWVNIDWNNAKVACANRKINGVSCHLVTMKEWATVCFLIKLLGHDVRGNNNLGKDIRDSSAYANYGVLDKSDIANANGRVLTGTGPISWSHNGMANGVFDIVGNIWEWVDFLINDGIYTHKKRALINDSDGITASDTTITLDNLDTGDTWETSGTVQIEDEVITYSNIDFPSSGSAILSGCKRGQESTKAAIHADNVEVYNLQKYHVIPGGGTAYLAADISATDTQLTYENLTNGPGSNGFAVGDDVIIGEEELKITAVNGNTLTVTRADHGNEGSTDVQREHVAKAHSKGAVIEKVSKLLNNGIWNGDITQEKRMTKLRREKDLEALALPSAFEGTGSAEEYKDYFYIRGHGARAALRGGNWSFGSSARSGFYLNLNAAPSDRWTGYGFRAAFSLSVI